MDTGPQDFDLVFAFPWSGEEPVMRDVMHRYGNRGARLPLYGASKGWRSKTRPAIAVRPGW
jgi:hypothetical protein